MKKISYFGKEYTVSGDIKWVATGIAGYVETFKQKPSKAALGWLYPDSLLDKLPSGSIDWKNSLRKVEDIIVRENELKVGDKVILKDDHNGFKKGQVVELYRLEPDGIHLFKGDNYLFTNLCGSHGGAYLSRGTYTVINESKPHPHADLMLKYAMIAQYDDKPWESFEVLLDGEWKPMDFAGMHSAFKYRLKPQEPTVQVGQIWVDTNVVEVTIRRLANRHVFTDINVGGITIPWSFKENEFFGNFKRKE